MRATDCPVCAGFPIPGCDICGGHDLVIEDDDGRLGRLKEDAPSAVSGLPLNDPGKRVA